jgi:dienelactone hydrolase
MAPAIRNATGNRRDSTDGPLVQTGMDRRKVTEMNGLSDDAAAGRGRLGTGPWDLAELQQAPSYDIAGTRQVQEGAQAVSLSELYYAAEPWLEKPTRVFAYYARPAEPCEKKLPAMVLIHGGGQTASPQWARLWAARGYAALAMDLYGQGPDETRLPDGGPDWGDAAIAWRLTRGVKNGWIYHAVATSIRAVSLLCALPEVDPDRVGVTGISWGGYFTCIVMSLDERLKLAAPLYGCGVQPTAGIDPEASEEERRTVRETFEPGLYLPRCEIPVLWVNETHSRYYWLDRFQKSYRATRGPRTLCVMVGPGHPHSRILDRGWEHQETHLFTDAMFRGTAALASVSLPEVTGKNVLVSYDSPVAVESAAIHWTAELTKPWPERQWQSRYGQLRGRGEARATLPEGRRLIFFMTLMDERGAVTSTERIELQ